MALAIAPLALLSPDTAAFLEHIAPFLTFRVVSQMVAPHLQWKHCPFDLHDLLQHVI
jgi:hypothetical protein